jgi:hypothetical protein
MFPPEKIARRICPRHQVVVLSQPAKELDLDLVPLPLNLRGFVPRIAAVTQAELDGVDLSYLNALAEQQRREGRMA